MSAGGGSSQDFELNLASIIDCFTVLIAFMLASASFLSIGILDAGVAAAAPGNPASGQPPSLNVAVELSAANRITVKLTGKTNSDQVIAASQGLPDYAALTRSLGATRAKYADVAAVTLTADNSVEYKSVVQAMEEIRKAVPVVLLGGF